MDYQQRGDKQKENDTDCQDYDIFQCPNSSVSGGGLLVGFGVSGGGGCSGGGGMLAGFGDSGGGSGSCSGGLWVIGLHFN
jgi:hypothetical protein